MEMGTIIRDENVNSLRFYKNGTETRKQKWQIGEWLAKAKI